MEEANLIPKKEITLSQIDTRAFPLTEKFKEHNGTAESTSAIIDFLDVSKSKRYALNGRQTFCNIYAYDFARLMGAYVPRVWWTEAAIKSGKMDRSVYGINVTEMNVNMLYSWFEKYSSKFGWKECKDFSEAQKMANEGRCVIGLAANKVSSKSGHIVAIVPENKDFKAIGSSGIVVVPVQSQAGAVNKKRFVSNWWSNGHRPIKIYYK